MKELELTPNTIDFGIWYKISDLLIKIVSDLLCITAKHDKINKIMQKQSKYFKINQLPDGTSVGSFVTEGRRLVVP